MSVAVLKEIESTFPTKQTKFVPLRMLRPGDEYPGGSINVRKSAAGADDDKALTASLKAEGVIQSLAVFSPDDLGEVLYVGAGNRRLRLLREAGLDDGTLVPVIAHYGCTPAEARAISLAENIARAPLHPVDRFEAFKQHADDGMSEVEIAARYAMPKKAVKQALALGALSPKVRDLWRAGKVDAETAQVFTLAQTHERQDEVLAGIKGRPYSHDVRRAILGDQNDVSGYLKFVGKKDYEEAGGSVIEDLFGGGKHASDVAMLKVLTEKKLQDECAKLEKDGWSWALTRDQVGSERYSWRRITPEPAFTPELKAKHDALVKQRKALKEPDTESDGWDEYYREEERLSAEIEAVEEAAMAAGFTAEQKAKSGCIVGLNIEGELGFEPGFVKPGAKLAAGDLAPADRKKAAAKKEAGGVSDALLIRLTSTLTEAAAASVAKDPKVALCALLAGHLTTWGSPVCVSSSGMGSSRDLGKPTNFENAFARVLEMTDKERNALLVKIVGDAIDLRSSARAHNQTGDKSAAALVEALPALGAELQKRFDAEDYFAGVSKDLCLEAVTEAINKDEARKIAGKPKGDVVKFAVANVPKTGWLPKALRTVHYAGPGAKKAPAKKAAKRGRK